MEYYKVCEVCGQIFSYTDQDIKNNNSASLISGLAALGTIAAVVGGTRYDMYEQSKLSDREAKKVVDYNKCPNCGSVKVKLITLNEAQKIMQRRENGGVQINSNASVDSLIKRIKLFIIDKEWIEAENYIHTALDLDPENGELYYLSLLVENECEDVEGLIKKQVLVENNKNYKKIMLFADDELKAKVKNIDNEILYRNALSQYNVAFNLGISGLAKLKEAVLSFRVIYGYSDSVEYIKKGEQKIVAIENEIEETRKNKIYDEAIQLINIKKSISVAEGAAKLRTIPGWKDSDELADRYEKEAEILKDKEAKSKRMKIIIAVAAVIIIAGGSFGISSYKKYAAAKKANEKLAQTYEAANNAFNNGDYKEAMNEYTACGDYEDAKDMVLESKYQYAVKCIDQKDFETAVNYSGSLENYKDFSALFNQGIEDCISNAISTHDFSALQSCEDFFTVYSDANSIREFINNKTYIEMNAEKSVWKFTTDYIESSNTKIGKIEITNDYGIIWDKTNQGSISVYSLKDYGYDGYYLIEFLSYATVIKEA